MTNFTEIPIPPGKPINEKSQEELRLERESVVVKTYNEAMRMIRQADAKQRSIDTFKQKLIDWDLKK